MLPLKNSDGTPVRVPPRASLTTDRVTHVGEPLAVVVAETVAAAKDAAELIEVDIEPLPAVVDLADAVADGAALLHPEAPGNVALDWTFGDAAAVEAAFAAAAHVTRLRLVNNRVVVAAMEPRSAVAPTTPRPAATRWSAAARGSWGCAAMLATVLGVAPHKVHVLTGDVGGSFGMKARSIPSTCRSCTRPRRSAGRSAGSTSAAAASSPTTRAAPRCSTPSSRSTPTAGSSPCGSTRSPTWAAGSPPWRP